MCAHNTQQAVARPQCVLYNTSMSHDVLRPSRASLELRKLLSPRPKMTQSKLAEELGVTQQAVSAWLKGISRPNADRIARIEELLGVPAEHWDELPDEPCSVAS